MKNSLSLNKEKYLIVLCISLLLIVVTKEANAISITSTANGDINPKTSEALIEYEGSIVYDVHNGITWLKDAKYALTSDYDSDGLMSWYKCMTWAQNLDYLGFTDWRLPETVPGTDKFYQTDSEMGYLYYALGNYAGYYGFHNPGSFENCGATNDSNSAWWSSTGVINESYSAWCFNWFTGAQDGAYKNELGHAWAVHEGNIGDQLGLNIASIYLDEVINGDFVISGTNKYSIFGDGYNEFTDWTFDFTTDTDYSSFSTTNNLSSACLTLTITSPKSTATDFINIDGLTSIISPEIQTIPSNVTSTVNIELLDFYNSDEIMNIFTSNSGKIAMHYEDDAVISHAQLILTSAPIPEPSTGLLFLFALPALIILKHKYTVL